MGATFAGRVILDPRTEAANCQRLGFPLDWLPKVNRYACPLGHKSGTGHVLMYRGDLDAIDVNYPADLVFHDGRNRVTLKRLHIASTTCITPGAPNDRRAVHLVELADHRRYFRLFPLDEAFNLVQTPTGNYAESTATSETVGYTWAQVWARIWAALPVAYAGPTPPLPEAPQGTPGRLDYYGWRAIDAAGHFLARCGFLLCWNPLTDAWSVVKPGDTQAGLAAAEIAGLPFRLFDAEPVSVGFGQLPANVEVYFRKEPTAAYGESPWEVKTVAALSPAAAGQAGTEILFDELPATYQGTTLTNDAELISRANDRATQFFRQRRDFLSTDVCKVYSGAQTKFLPGSQVGAVEWEDAGGRGNVKTYVRRASARDPMADWPAPAEQPWRLVALAETQTSGDTPPTDYGDIKVKLWNTDDDDQEDVLDAWSAPATAGLALFVGFKDGRPVYVPASGGGGWERVSLAGLAGSASVIATPQELFDSGVLTEGEYMVLGRVYLAHDVQEVALSPLTNGLHFVEHFAQVDVVDLGGGLVGSIPAVYPDTALTILKKPADSGDSGVRNAYQLFTVATHVDVTAGQGILIQLQTSNSTSIGTVAGGAVSDAMSVDWEFHLWRLT